MRNSRTVRSVLCADQLRLHRRRHLLERGCAGLHALEAGLVDHRRPRDVLLRLEALELGSELLPDLRVCGLP